MHLIVMAIRNCIRFILFARCDGRCYYCVVVDYCCCDSCSRARVCILIGTWLRYRNSADVWLCSRATSRCGGCSKFTWNASGIYIYIGLFVTQICDRINNCTTNLIREIAFGHRWIFALKAFYICLCVCWPELCVCAFFPVHTSPPTNFHSEP